MTEIRFTRDYRGKLTQELFYEAGTVKEFPDGVASEIVAESAAVIVEAVPEPVKPTPTPEPVKPTPTPEPVKPDTKTSTRSRRTAKKLTRK